MEQLREATTDQLATRLRQKSENCELADKECEIKSQHSRVRIKCLEEDKNLTDMLSVSRTMEIALKQAECKNGLC